ncbi:MAG: aldo/keto reductase, partial [Bacteroidota bacterium]
LQTSNSEVKVATKFGRKSDLFPDNYSEQALRECVDDSRRRLQVDCIDLLQLHCLPTEVLKNSHIFDWLRNLKEEGKIAHFGASVESVEQGLICLEQEGLQSLQVIYNIFRQKLNEALLPQALKKGVGIIVRLPLASGLLTGKFTQRTKFSATDHRHYNRDGAVFNVGETFAGLPFDIGVQLSEELKTLFPQDSSVSKVALRWLLDHEAVSTIIPGASSPAQVYENASASDLPSLDEKLRNDLKDFYKKHVADHIRGIY